MLIIANTAAKLYVMIKEYREGDLYANRTVTKAYREVFF